MHNNNIFQKQHSIHKNTNPQYNDNYKSVYVTSPPLSQYVNRSGGHTAVPVCERVTGLQEVVEDSAGRVVS